MITGERELGAETGRTTHRGQDTNYDQARRSKDEKQSAVAVDVRDAIGDAARGLRRAGGGAVPVEVRQYSAPYPCIPWVDLTPMSNRYMKM